MFGWLRFCNTKYAWMCWYSNWAGLHYRGNPYSQIWIEEPDKVFGQSRYLLKLNSLQFKIKLELVDLLKLK